MFRHRFSCSSAVAAATLFWLAGAAGSSWAQEAAVGPEAVIQQMEQAGADPQARLAALAEVKEFPGAVLIGLLDHPELKVRSAALEWLESRAGSDFGYDPFLPQSEGSRQAVTAWQDWWKADDGKPADSEAKKGVLTEDRFLAAVGGLLSGKVEQRERSWQALAVEGLGSAGRLERWLGGQTDLPEGSRGRIREAQFRLVIASVARTEAAALARDLVFGTRQAKLGAMGRLKGMGPVVVPVLLEFLADADPLIRETAVECLLKAGGRQATPLVQPRLKVEQDENVLHAIVRGCEDSSDESVKILAAFTDHANEDLAVASLQALGRLKANDVEDRVMAAFSDSRWRVRTAALEAVGGMKLAKASSQVMKALQDADPFVISTAVSVAGKMELKSAAKTLEALGLADPAQLAPVVEALLTMNLEPGAKLVEGAMKAPGEHALSFVQAIVRKERGVKALVTLAGHADPDVAAAAIQGLAKAGTQEAQYRSLIRAALEKVSGEPAKALLAALDTKEMQLAGAAAKPSREQEIARELALGLVDNENTDVEKLEQNPDVSALYELVGASAEPEPPAPERPSWSFSSSSEWKDAELQTLLEKFLKDESHPELALLAAQKLAIPGHAEACQYVLKRLPELAVHERAGIADSLYSGGYGSGKVPLLRALVTDEAVTVRQEAVYSTIEHAEDSAEYTQMLLGALDDPGNHLRPEEITGYTLYSFDDEAAKALARNWALKQLADEAVAVPRKVLALVLLGPYAQKGDTNTLLSMTRASDPWLRRAAWYSLVRLKAVLRPADLKPAAEDPSAKVREVVPYALTREEMEWRNWFSERVVKDSDWSLYASDRPKALPDEAKELLVKLSEDEDPEVRLGAMLGLLSHRVEVPLPELTAALEGYPDQEALPRRSARFLTEHYQRLGAAGRLLLRYADLAYVSSSNLDEIQRRFKAPAAAGVFTSFAALAGLSEEAGNEPVVPAAEEEPEVLQEKVKLVYFFKPGCQDCVRVRDQLAGLRKDLPWLEVEEFSVESAEGAERNQLLVKRRQVDPGMALLTPAVFSQAGAVIRDGVDAGSIRSLAERSRVMKPEPGWDAAAAADRAEAAQEIESRYQNFGLGWVVLAGLLDGINPCAFATIIFFLSYLRVAKRSPREILMVGGAFVLAVFLAYFVVGLGLSRVLTQIQGLEGARLWLNRGLAVVALVIALISLRDAVRAWQGKLSEMSMQLPEGIKKRIRGVIRQGARQRNFVVAAFVTGVVISFLELACTGQVYLPTIAYMMEQGRLSAVGWLLVYNLAFILPLVVIFVLAYFGLTSEALVAFQKKHTGMVRLGTALLFLTLFLVLVLSGSTGWNWKG